MWQNIYINALSEQRKAIDILNEALIKTKHIHDAINRWAQQYITKNDYGQDITNS